jgi:hypothetical protein
MITIIIPTPMEGKLMKETFITSIIGILAIIAIADAQTEYSIWPDSTDPSITISSSPHYVVIDKVTDPLNKLFFFFPGTGATPKMYSEVCKTAARSGYHVISLSYINDQSINMDICTTRTAADTNCYRNARYEILTGEDTHASVDVSLANSAFNRLIKLLQYLTAHYPEDGWGQFLSGDSEVNWPLVATSGHSQGGGHAGFVCKMFPLYRCIMFNATDWDKAAIMPANWIREPGETPSERIYGFTHTKEVAVSLTIEIPTWEAYGIDAFGQLTNVDSTDSPYNNSHMLCTSIDSDEYTTPLEKGSYYHNASCVDAYLPRNNDGTPVYEPVWEYLLGKASSSSIQGWMKRPGKNTEGLQGNITVTGNALLMRLASADNIQAVEIRDIAGRTIFTFDVPSADISALPRGVYIIRLINAGKMVHSLRMARL